MPIKTNNQSIPINIKKHKPLPTKLIFVGSDKLQLNKAKTFSKENKLLLMTYSEQEWATLEEIDQYIQEEELSKQVINLPVGKDFSLTDMEENAIKSVLKHVSGNKIQAARFLQIARATLYRKMKKHGLNLKQQRKKYFKLQKKIFKNVA